MSKYYNCLICGHPVKSESGRKRLHGELEDKTSCAWQHRQVANIRTAERAKEKRQREKLKCWRRQGYAVGGDDSWLNG